MNRQARYYTANTEKVLAVARLWSHNFPHRRAYAEQITGARKRGIAWEFTFEEWWNCWWPHWQHRGRKGHELQMTRYGDIGPYSPANIKIVTANQNKHDRIPT